MSRCKGQIIMGFFDRFRKENRAEEGTVSFDDALLEALLSRKTVTKEVALQIPTVSGGIDLIANIVAGTPIRLYRDEGGKAEEVTDDYRLALLNDETGDTLNANEFWHAMIRDYYTGKGGYAFLNKIRGKIRSVHYVEEDRVSIIKNADPIFKAFDIQVNGATYKPWDFFRILRNTRDGAEGVPITKENSKLIEVAYQQMQLEYAMAKRGGNKKGFLKAERRLDEASMTALKHSWASLYANDSENMMVLNKDVDFKELSDTSTEMQLDENKRTNAQEFAKIFHISPEAMSGSEKDIGALAKLAAIPLMQVIECALNRDLLLEKEKGSLYFAFDTKELLKGSRNERAEFYAKMIDANVMQIDEVRYMEDLPALGLDFIKLGLQDVLYDPKTKTVYTPNTNQTGGLGASAQLPGTEPAAEDGETEPLPENPEDGIIEPEKPGERGGDYIQNPETGLMEGSTPSGDSSGSGGSKSGKSSKEGKKTAKDQDDGNERRKKKLEKWDEQSKGYEEARKEIQRRIDDGEYSLQLQHQKYLQHVKDTAQFKNVEKTRGRKQSYLTISEQDAQRMINKYSAKGDPKVSSSGEVQNIEFGNAPTTIGYYFEKGSYRETKRFAIDHNKNGSHIYPVKPRE